MTDNGEVPHISDEDIEAFVKSASESQEREDDQADRAQRNNAEQERIAKEVGYVTLDDPGRHREALSTVLDTLSRECVESGVYPNGAEEMYYLAQSRVEERRIREHLLVVDASIIRVKGNFGMLEGGLLATKRRTLVEAIIIEGFHSTDAVVQYVNHLIPGPVIDLEKEDMTAETAEAFAKLASHDALNKQYVEESRQLIRAIGLVDVSTKVRFGVSMIVSLSKMDIAKNTTMRQREERVLMKIRELGLATEVAAKLLEHINEKYPLQ